MKINIVVRTKLGVYSCFLYVLLRIKNRVKTKDVYFVQDYWKQILFFLFFLFLVFLDFPFLFFFGFSFFLFFLIFPFFYFSFYFFFWIFFNTSRGCLLNWAYDPQAAKSESHPFFSHIGAYLIGLTIHKLPKAGLILFSHRCLLDWAYDP